MQLLKQKILQQAEVFPGNILKVDSFLNHQLDTALLVEIGKEFAAYFKQNNITKIVTIESSGIAAAVTTGIELKVPVVFARKQKSLTVNNEVYSAPAYSYTKQATSDVIVKKQFILPTDNILIIDDFLAHGEATLALASIIKQAGATVAGIGIVIEKAFQDGGKKLRAAGYNLFSLARIKSIAMPKKIDFEDNDANN